MEPEPLDPETMRQVQAFRQQAEADPLFPERLRRNLSVTIFRMGFENTLTDAARAAGDEAEAIVAKAETNLLTAIQSLEPGAAIPERIAQEAATAIMADIREAIANVRHRLAHGDKAGGR